VRKFLWILMFVLALPFAAPLVRAQASGAAAAPHQAATTFADPALEARVLAIAEELRCLVCQNETIAASHAELAVDLRKQIRTKLGEGQSKQQILDFMADRYGDFVLYRPRWKASTIMLWAGPFALLLVALTTLALNIRRRRQSVASAELTPAEAERARRLLDGTPPAAAASPTTSTRRRP
jgi:cytochrome c-type biogenesis protein CcmH